MDNTMKAKLTFAVTLTPAFQTIIGGFIGLLAGVKLSHDDDVPPCKKD